MSPSRSFSRCVGSFAGEEGREGAHRRGNRFGEEEEEEEDTQDGEGESVSGALDRALMKSFSSPLNVTD